MSKTNTKEQEIQELKELLDSSNDIILIDYRGLTVSQLTDFRKKISQKAILRIVKNNLFKKALKETDFPDLEDNLLGPTAVFFCKEESGPIAKAIFKNHIEFQQKFSIKCGVIAGDLFDKDQLEQYSKLPSKEELIAKLMGTMNAPVQNTAGLLSEIIGQFLRTLKAYQESKN